MAMDDAACAQLERRIADLERHVARLQEILDTEPDLSGGTVQNIRRQIREANNTLAELRHELILCRSDITIVGVEQTQGTQFFAFNGQGSEAAPDNSVPLIAQRMAVLRVYIDCKRAAAQQPAQLPIRITGRVTVDRIQRNGSIIRVSLLQPINGPIAARSAASIDRGEADHTLNFRVPAVDCQGLLRFTITVFEQGLVVSDDVALATRRGGTGSAATPPKSALEPETTAMAPGAFTLQSYGRFEPVPTFRVHAVLVHYTGEGMDLPAPTGFDFADTLDYVLRTYPIGRLEFEDCIEIDFDKSLRTPGGGCGPGFEGPGGLLDILKDLDDSSDRPAIRVALIPSGAATSVAGCGNRNVAAAKDGQGSVLAQEMGHALDRKHAPAGGAPGADPNYPDYNGYQSGSIGEYGFDVVNSDVYDPRTSTDFMGYAGNRWVSPYTYMGLRDAMIDRFGAAFARPPGGRFASMTDDSPRETLFLSFRVLRDDRVQLHPSFHFPARKQADDGSPFADVSCELIDADGDVLSFTRCRLRDPHADPDSPCIAFHETMPWVDEAAAIRFVRGREVLHTHEIEPRAPTVKLPAGVRSANEQFTLKWQGQHPESDLTYLVRYSNDGGATWRGVAASADKSQCALDEHRVPGGEQCLLQVIASSGIRTAVAQTKPFSVPSDPRSAAIISAAGESAAPGQAILRGGAFSSDHGLAPPEDVVWSSNVDGVLGRGIELVASGLSEGLHTITLTAPDGQGGVATTSRAVRIRLVE